MALRARKGKYESNTVVEEGTVVCIVLVTLVISFIRLVLASGLQSLRHFFFVLLVRDGSFCPFDQVVNIANDQRTLKEIENKILYMLANASGKLRVNVASKACSGSARRVVNYARERQKQASELSTKGYIPQPTSKLESSVDYIHE